ncbi:MAG: delta-1-pyrroline-5-carboxylate dehydrogenase [Azospirillum brasilense]|nr:MAG: delta-1-pyrroline-5-carboxylate dehydrogenase [Azospirillum brasilense]
MRQPVQLRRRGFTFTQARGDAWAMDWNREVTAISAQALADETKSVQALLARVGPLLGMDAAVRARAETLIANQRAIGPGGTVEAFLQSYGLSTKEGIALLCLAEALLRIPDSTTADQLIEDTFATGNWKQHLNSSDSTLVNAGTWGLMLTGAVLNMGEGDSPASWFGGLIKRSGEPVIRNALRAGMKFLGSQFVMGESVADAIKNARGPEKQGYTLSYDILGEGARTEAQAQRYIASYLTAIGEIAAGRSGSLFEKPGISVKLSALHPRYSASQSARVMGELYPRMTTIVRAAKQAGIAVSFDAEEAYRLDLSLHLYERVLRDPEFADFHGIGWVMQAYQKRAIHVAEALSKLAISLGRRLPVRLVKGAYWDSEVKYAQAMGLPGYPVFTRKIYTDVSYLACAQQLLAAGDAIYPQFATHNALTAATIIELATAKGRAASDFEFQRLHGMGETLHDQLIGQYRCRIYAPVGEHKDLLAYLIRRLLENGANTSFVHLLLDQTTPIEQLSISPIAEARQAGAQPNPEIPMPHALYGASRKNSDGIEFGYEAMRTDHLSAVQAAFANYPAAPADTAVDAVPAMMQRAQTAWRDWQAQPVAVRADMLRRAADAMEQRMAELCALCIQEAKKTHADAVAEVREAVDFLRYYAAEAERVMAPQLLPGPTGERNELSLHGRGVFVCISPWNFPLAIFIGQVAAALVTGNSVLAKPAEQTPRIAAAAIAMLHEAGIPQDVLQLACGLGETVGAALVAQPGVAGVCFTGSTQVAKMLQRALAEKDGPIVPLIAETGGQNAMIVDSSALLEQAVDDVITSAFGSAGQRCSALRALFVQEEVAEEFWALLTGAMDELKLGDPRELSTDIPPVIDREAQQGLLAHIEAMKPIAKKAHAAPAPSACANETFVVPHAFWLEGLHQLTREQFGPVLHLFPFKASELNSIIGQIHATGYGLTFGLHTRLRSTMDDVLNAVHVGNRYVNRSMIGAVVGVQPFGGEGLSGTGPKAGGPHYLPKFCAERTTTINTAAIGGNVELLR